MASTVEEALDEAVAEGYITDAQRTETLQQRDHFEQQRAFIEATYPGQTVAVANLTIYAGDDLAAVEAQIPSTAMYYVELIVGPV